MSSQHGHVYQLQRSTEYWLGRAARHRRQGNRRRAAALLRHALSLSPDDEDLRLEYARTLQEMECYEASNRAAFGALTLNPRQYACYGLIGRNMLALGYEQEAMDAFSRYLWAARRASGDIAEFDDDLDQLEATEEDRERMRARYEAQLNIAGRRLAAGDLPRAERALLRARPARDMDDRYDALRALLAQAKGDNKNALRHALRASRRNPASVRARCTLAGAYCLAGKRARGASTLLAAALICETQQEEQLFCYSAMSLGFPELALSQLRSSLKQSPDRLPAIYNASLMLLKLGREDDAEAYIHRCRDLDPTDVPVRCIARTVEQWRDLGLLPHQVRFASRALPLYPLLAPAQSNDCLAMLANALTSGLEDFCDRLQEDEFFYNLLLYELGDADHQLARLIPAIVKNLPVDFAQQLLREVLVQHTPDDTAKRYAAAALMTIGAKPPFVVWHAGRIAEIDPSVENRHNSSFSRLMLLRRMVNIQRRAKDPRLMTHALHILQRMNRRERNSVVRDTVGVFRAALEQHYLLTYRLPDSDQLQILLKYNNDEHRHMRAAFRLFCRLLPLPER